MGSAEYNRRYYLAHGGSQTLKARLARAEAECATLRAELEAEHRLNHRAVAEVARLRAEVDCLRRTLRRP